MKPELAALRNARSKKDFPNLKLEDGEYVELAIRRSKVGVLFIWGATALGSVLLLALAILTASGAISVINPVFGVTANARSFLMLSIIILFGILFIFGIVSTRVYNDNLLYVTNKRLIHNARASLFAQSTNVIELVSIEDVSFSQSGLTDYLFGIGTFRMSTVGDETTYTFKYADSPKNEIEIVTHLIHVAKEASKENNR